MAKYYFKDESSEMCYDLEGIKDIIASEGLKEMEVFEAVRSVGEGLFWCKVHCFAAEKSEAECGKSCKEYEPRNGKSGICKNQGYCYNWGEKVLIKL